MMDSINEYKFRPDREYQGLAVVIVNFTEERTGAKEDIIYMTKTFEILGFKVKLYQNLTKRMFVEVINYYSKDETLTDYDSFVFAISTHGMELERVKRAGEDYVVHHHALLMNDDQGYYTATILEKFKKCKALKGKPKLFFIQACRIPESKSSKKHRVQGIGFDAGTSPHMLDQQEPDRNIDRPDMSDNGGSDIWRVGEDQDPDSDMKIDHENLTKMDNEAADNTVKSLTDEAEDSKETLKEGLLELPAESGKLGDEVDPPRAIRYRPAEAPLHITAVPCHNDMLIVFASPEGHYAIRNEDIGSYMLKYLHDSVINVYGEDRLLNNRTNFLYILNDVAAKMSSNVFCDGKYKNVTCVVHKLSKDIVFSKGENM